MSSKGGKPAYEKQDTIIALFMTKAKMSTGRRYILNDLDGSMRHHCTGLELLDEVTGVVLFLVSQFGQLHHRGNNRGQWWCIDGLSKYGTDSTD